MAEDIYDELLHMISKEAVRMSEAPDNDHGLGPGACAGAIMSTLIFAWADQYGPAWETVIDASVGSAKDTLRLKRESEAASHN